MHASVAVCSTTFAARNLAAFIYRQLCVPLGIAREEGLRVARNSGLAVSPRMHLATTIHTQANKFRESCRLIAR